MGAERASRLEGKVVSSRSVPPPVPAISAAVAIGRRERLRAVVEKLAELGCSRFLPLECEHLQYPGKLERQAEKLQEVAVSALKQCRRPHLMQIGRPVDIAGLLDAAGKGAARPVFCHRTGTGGKTLKRAGEPLGKEDEFVLVVGPEGGFSSAERSLIESSGCPCLELGRWWLRSETAALAGFTLLASELWGELGIFSC